MLKLYRNLNIALLILGVMLAGNTALAKKATIALKNGKVVTGDLVEEAPEYVLLVNHVGQIKINRDNIETISYNAFDRFKESNDETVAEQATETLRDRVVVHFKSGEIVDGFVLAKSLSMVMLETENGRLTIPKRDIRLIEYVSSAYAERGEPAIVRLDNNTKLEGFIYHEDKNTLTMETKMGRLTIDKRNLRSVEYGEIKLPAALRQKEKQVEALPSVTFAAEEASTLLKERRDVVELGYSPRFGANYSPGLSASYRSRFPLKTFPSFQLNAEASLGMTLFSLDTDAFSEANTPAAVTVTGGSFITTLGAGLPVHFYPKNGSSYEFFFAPALETHIVHNQLKQNFPSFPALNTETSETNVNFGVGARLGLEWITTKWRAGFVYNAHLILGENDFGHFSLYLVRKLF